MYILHVFGKVPRKGAINKKRLVFVVIILSLSLSLSLSLISDVTLMCSDRLMVLPVSSGSDVQ